MPDEMFQAGLWKQLGFSVAVRYK